MFFQKGLLSRNPQTMHSLSSYSSMHHHYHNSPIWSLSPPLHSKLSSFPVSFSIRHCSSESRNGSQKLKSDVKAGKRPDFRLKGSRTSESGATESAKASNESPWVNGIRKRVDAIKSMLGSMDEGEESISASAYNTAWVALVEDVNGSGGPQFPSSLQWIINNQLPDGSWGDSGIFLAFDRLLCTLACVIALRFWNVHPEMSDKGLKFFRENINKLETENIEHMTCGFETILPALLQMAQSLSIEVPDDFAYLKEICKKRDEKFRRIPRDIIHQVPTSLLLSLESVPGLEWRKLMKLQSQDGSFLFCPSSTAFAFIQTKDEKCLTYLNNVVAKFNGGVPDFYPMDLFERIWAVDRLARLGISRYFQQEIKEFMSYVHRYWNEKGIGWTRFSKFPDIDDTAMGFRLLRLHGYQVSANVFQNFKKGNKFFCMPGQSNEAGTAMFNLYRASQLQFPGEKVLEYAKNFATKILIEKRASNYELLDKWIIAKDIAGEVSFALDIPWYMSLPRIETRFYLEQYGGEDDVWISKSLYRLHKVSNRIYRELGKLDYNSCQSLHRTEWERIQEWYRESGLEQFGLSREKIQLVYFLAAASIFESERSQERFAWVQTKALVETITSTYNDQEHRTAFVHEFTHSTTKGWVNTKKNKDELVVTLQETLLHLSLSSPTTPLEIIHDIWKNWLWRWQSEGDRCQGEAELLIKMIHLKAGYIILQEQEHDPEYQQLCQLANRLCYRLRYISKNKIQENYYNGSWKMNKSGTTRLEMESEMQELVKLVLQSSSNGIDSNIKNTFLIVTKSFYYLAYCDPKTINFHIAKVLFEPVV